VRRRAHVVALVVALWVSACGAQADRPAPGPASAAGAPAAPTARGPGSAPVTIVEFSDYQ